LAGAARKKVKTGIDRANEKAAKAAAKRKAAQMESGDVGPVESGTAASLEESPDGDGVVADAAAKDSESRPQNDEDAISDIESDGGADLATRRAAASGVDTAAEPDEHDESMDPIEDTDAVPDAETQDPALGETMPPEVPGCWSF